MKKHRLASLLLIFLCLAPVLLEGQNMRRDGSRGRLSNIIVDTFEETRGNGLVVYSNPPATIFIDGVERGSTPYFNDTLPPGTYSIRLSTDGYVDKYFSVTLFSNSRLIASIKMQEEMGSVRITVKKKEGSPSSGGEDIPFAPQIILDSSAIDMKPLSSDSDSFTATIDMQIGLREIRARAFGWSNGYTQVQVYRNTVSTAEIILERVELRLSNRGMSRKKFNPKSTGNFSFTECNYEVNAYGYGTFTVLDKDEEIVYKRRLDNFTTWNQSVTWDGKGFDGQALPEGRYTIMILGYSHEDDELPVAGHITFETEIDYSINIFPLSLSGGISGLTFAMMPHVLPSGSFQIEGGILFGNFYSSAPFDIGLRASPFKNLEISSVININPHKDEPGWGLTGAFKYNILGGTEKSEIQFALSAGASFVYANEYGEAPLSAGRGIGLHAPLSFELENFSLVISPSAFWHRLESPAPLLLLGTGFFYRHDWFNAGLSFRVDFNFEDFESTRYLAGAEIRFYPSPSYFVITLKGGVWAQEPDIGGYGGVGIGFIY